MEKGQKMIRIGNQVGKPPVAYIMSDPNGLHIFLSDKLEGGKRFPVHIDKINKLWKPAKVQKRKSKGSPEELTGKQSKIFPESKTVREMWRDKTLKNGRN